MTLWQAAMALAISNFSGKHQRLFDKQQWLQLSARSLACSKDSLASSNGFSYQQGLWHATKTLWQAAMTSAISNFSGKQQRLTGKQQWLQQSARSLACNKDSLASSNGFSDQQGLCQAKTHWQAAMALAISKALW